LCFGFGFGLGLPALLPSLPPKAFGLPAMLRYSRYERKPEDVLRTKQYQTLNLVARLFCRG
jgi:hypothetical protein